jgi:hypothetical protein
MLQGGTLRTQFPPSLQQLRMVCDKRRLQEPGNTVLIKKEVEKTHSLKEFLSSSLIPPLVFPAPQALAANLLTCSAGLLARCIFRPLISAVNKDRQDQIKIK